MGTFRVNIEVGSAGRDRFESVAALVDTGATYTVLPRALLRDRGVSFSYDGFVRARRRPRRRARSRASMDPSRRREEFSLVVFGDEALLGAVTLEELRLAPDPVSKRLLPVPARLLLAAV